MTTAPAAPRWVLACGLAAFLAGGALYVYPAAQRIETRLSAEAQAALTSQGLDVWARTAMDGQCAVLSGLAPTPVDRDQAVAALRGAHGKGGWFLGGVTCVEDRTQLVPVVSPFIWRADLAAGELTITGSVTSKGTRMGLDAAARPHFAGLQDHTQLARGAPNNWEDIAKRAMSALARLTSGRAELRDHALTITGVAPDAKTAADVQAALAALPPPFQGRAMLSAPAERDHMAAGRRSRSKP